MGTIVHPGRTSWGRPAGPVDVGTAPAPGRSESAPLLEGDRGTVQTIRLIRRAVRDSLIDPYVRSTLARIVRSVPPHDDVAEARAIYEWVLRNIRFTKDPVDHETISDAKWTLTHGIGDCDDINGVLLPALLMAAGHPTRLVTIGNQPAAPEAFSHIYAEVQLQGRWIPVDAARSGARFGVGPTRYFRKRIWSLVEDRHEDVAGLSGTRVELGGFADVWRKISEGVTAGVAAITAATMPTAEATPSFIPTATAPAAAPIEPTVSIAGREIPQNYLLLGLAALALFMLRKK